MRIIGRSLRILLFTFTLLVATAAASVIVMETAWFKNWLRDYLVREANQYLNGELSIGRLGGNLFSGVALEQVGVSMDGQPVVTIESIRLNYDVIEMISNGVSIARISLNRPVINLARRDDTWTIARLVKPRKEQTDPTGTPRPIAIKQIEITDGTVDISGQDTDGAVRVPHRFAHIDANLAFTYQAAHYTIDVAKMSFRTSDPEIGLNALSGTIAVDDAGVAVRKLALRTEESDLSVDGTVQKTPAGQALDFAVDAGKLSLPEIGAVVPAVKGIQLQPAFEIKLSGPTNRLAIDLNVRSAAGQFAGTMVVDLAQSDQSVTGDMVFQHLDLAPILRDPEMKSDLSGKAMVDLHGSPLSASDSLRWSVALESPHLAALGYVADDVTVRAQIAGPRITFNGRARAYGASATSIGVITLKSEKRPLTYELHGVARHVDLRRLPPQVKAPQTASDISAAYQVSGSVPGGTGKNRVIADGRFEASTLAGIRIAAGSTGGATVNGSDIHYRGDANLVDLNLRRVGEAFNVSALATERFDSTINGHVTVSGRGTTVREMSLTACGTLTDSSLLGAHISDLTFDTELKDDALHVTAVGNVDHVDLKAAVGRPSLEGQVNGSIDVRATVANISQGVAADQVEATGRVELKDSTVGKIVIDRAKFDGDYQSSSATIRVLDVTGPAASVQAQGTLALDESGESSLTFHADAPSLEEAAKLLDKPLDKALAGIVAVDGTVTGNKRELTVSGRATANGLKYDTSGALAATTDYSVRLPNLSMDAVAVTAATNATFVTVAGQNINELAAKTDYAGGQLTFDVTARQPNRSVSVAGDVALQSEQREVRLQRLEAATQGLNWQLAPGAQPAIRYADQAIVVKDLRLQSGQQQAKVDGSLGRAGDALDVTLDNVDLAAVDAVLLRPPQFSGRLHATARVTGTLEQPHVRSEFQVTQGGFRQFKYSDLSGTVDYGGKGVTLDAKLQQDATASLTAKGYVPLALFKGPGNAPASHGATVPPEDAVNLKIDSSPIQLGLIQGFTTAVTNVTGTLQANLEVTGAADDPHPGGSIALQDAAFTVGATGVTYSGGSGRVDFAGDRVHIEQFRVMDNNKKPLVVTGDLAIHERELGGVDLTVKSDDFRVINNKLGDLRINTDLHVAGELRYPRIEGALGISTGSINLDEILAATSDSAYATTPISAPGEQAGSAEQAPAAPSLFDALSMDVHVTVPNDLVVKGADLRVPDAPVGLGAVNVTLGGDLWVSKTPWDRPRLTGSVNTVRGTYDFQGRRFDILRDGTARFDGLDEQDPILDIRAERVIQGVRTNVNVRGTVRRPDIVLSSTPPLEQSDILALIVFNQPANQIGEGQQISLVQRAQSMALGALAGELASSIGSALDLNTFEIQVAPDSGAAAQVTVGQQLSQNLFVKVEQGIGDQSTTNVVIEYQLGNWLLLQTNVREGSTTLQPFQRVQGSGVDLIFFFSY